MFASLFRIKNSLKSVLQAHQKERRLKSYFTSGRIPWSVGYLDYRNRQIETALKQLPVDFTNWGVGLDERVVEMPWCFQELKSEARTILDAGSSLNHDFVLDQKLLEEKELSICTFYPESYSRLDKRISYVFADLRNMPFRDEWFDAVMCISTIEHIDMDNSMYGYTSSIVSTEKSYGYLLAISEMVRVLKSGGQLLLTFPFGRFENHGFFQQLDREMVDRISHFLSNRGTFTATFFKYEESGWIKSTEAKCGDSESFNPHTGKGKKNDGAAHSRAICCISFIKAGK